MTLAINLFSNFAQGPNTLSWLSTLNLYIVTIESLQGGLLASSLSLSCFTNQIIKASRFSFASKSSLYVNQSQTLSSSSITLTKFLIDFLLPTNLDRNLFFGSLWKEDVHFFVSLDQLWHAWLIIITKPILVFYDLIKQGWNRASEWFFCFNI